MYTPRFAILLSTYNGEKYLGAQLDSLFSQTLQDFVLVVRDDGSTDGTKAILESYITRYPDRIFRIDDDRTNLGASASFSALIAFVLELKSKLGLASAYMMFCDQDDVWQPHKLKLQWQTMTQCESRFPGKPVLVHCDLRVVTADGDSIAPSMAAYQGLETHRNSFHHLVLSNLVTGCTAFINEALARKALPVPEGAMMHDWWLALAASAFGRVHYMNESLVDYRQHGANVIGARKKIPDGLRNASFWKRVVEPGANPHLFEVARQAGQFRRRYGRELSFKQRMSLRGASLMALPVGLLQRLLYKLLRKF